MEKKNDKDRVVLIEDTAEYQEIIHQHLSPRFELIKFHRGDEAVKYLREKDQNHSVSCIISDWRLFEKGSKSKWQQIQGYQALYEIGMFHPASLVSLTSEIDKNVHGIRNKLGLNITLFRKQHLEVSEQSDELWKLFADTISDLCVQSQNLVASLPTGSKWTKEEARNKFKSLKTKYLSKRRNDWAAFENSISEKADEYWRYYNAALTDLDPFLDSIEERYGLILSDNLESILIVRRLWLALWFSKDKISYIPAIMPEETPSINIYIVLYNYQLQNEENRESQKLNSGHTPTWKSELENRASTFVNTLCIKSKELPSKGLLPEERAWLLRQGFDIQKNANEYE